MRDALDNFFNSQAWREMKKTAWDMYAYYQVRNQNVLNMREERQERKWRKSQLALGKVVLKGKRSSHVNKRGS